MGVVAQVRLLELWTESNGASLIRLALVQVTTNKVSISRDNLLAAESRQKGYADQRR